MDIVNNYEIGLKNLKEILIPSKLIISLQLKTTAIVFFIFTVFVSTPLQGKDWVEVKVGVDSGDTYLWPYFHTASRFIDIDSIEKDKNYVMYRELVDSIESKSPNVISLIVEKKSRCDGKAVLWKSFVIYDSNMGQGKAIMKLIPNESEPLEKGSAGSITDAFVCNLNQ